MNDPLGNWTPPRVRVTRVYWNDADPNRIPVVYTFETDPPGRAAPPVGAHPDQESGDE